MSRKGDALPLHKDCANFSNGFCLLHKIPVDPDEPACADFFPKEAPQIPQIPLVYPLRAGNRRRNRRRRRMGWKHA